MESFCNVPLSFFVHYVGALNELSKELSIACQNNYKRNLVLGLFYKVNKTKGYFCNVIEVSAG